MCSGNEQYEPTDDLAAPLKGDYIRAQTLYSLIERLSAYEDALGQIRAREKHYQETLGVIRSSFLPITDQHILSFDFFLSGYDPVTQSKIIKNIQDIGKMEGFDSYEEWQRTYLLTEGTRNNIIDQSVALYVDTHYRNPQENLINFSEDAMIRAHAGLTTYIPHSVMMTALRLVILRDYALSKIAEENTSGMYQ